MKVAFASGILIELFNLALLALQAWRILQNLSVEL
jgi:hypothetical protein